MERAKGSEMRTRPAPRPVARDRSATATTTTTTAPRTGGSNTIFWWHLATFIDIVHFPFLILMVVLGAMYFSGPVFVFLLTLMVTLQVATLGCPVMWLTGQLRQIHDPDYEIKWSFTAWLYEQYGRWVGVAVFCFFGGLTLAVRFLFF